MSVLPLRMRFLLTRGWAQGYRREGWRVPYSELEGTTGGGPEGGEGSWREGGRNTLKKSSLVISSSLFLLCSQAASLAAYSRFTWLEI